MHGALYDDLIAAGGIRLITDDARQRAKCKTGRPLIWAVLAHLAINANSDCHSWPSTQSLAEDLGLFRSDVRHALDVLVAAKLIVLVGYVGRARRWRVQVPDSARVLAGEVADMSAIRSAETLADASADASAETLADYVADMSAAKGREVKRTVARARPRETRRDATPTVRRWADDLAALFNSERPEQPIDANGQRYKQAARIIATTSTSTATAVHAAVMVRDPRPTDTQGVTGNGLILRRLEEIGDYGLRSFVDATVQAAVAAEPSPPEPEQDATSSRRIDEEQQTDDPYLAVVTRLAAAKGLPQ